MREIIRYEAFDGTYFDNREACEDYERNHILSQPEEIKFYSINGKKIKSPCESVFLDSSRFIAHTPEALRAYQDYCVFLGLKVPPEPIYLVPFPRHYMFSNGEWACLEAKILEAEHDIQYCFLDEYEDNEEDRHNLVDKGYEEQD